MRALPTPLRAVQAARAAAPWQGIIPLTVSMRLQRAVPAEEEEEPEAMLRTSAAVVPAVAAEAITIKPAEVTAT